MIASELCVIAGPRSIGKSHFIKNCRKNPAGLELPSSLREHFMGGPSLIHLKQLGECRNANLPRATIHLDIFTPFLDLPPLPEHEFFSEINADNFAAFPDIDTLADTDRLLVVTLKAPRRLVLNRWLDRMAHGKHDMVRTNLTRMYSDASGDLLFNRLYEAWNGFLDSMTITDHWLADVSGETQVIFTRR